MSWRRFVTFDLAAGAVWSAVFLGLGYLLRDQIQEILDMLANAGLVALLALALVIALFLAQRAWRRYRFEREAAAVRITAVEVLSLMKQGQEAVFVDVRAEASRMIDPRQIPGALQAELHTIQDKAMGLSKDSLLVLYCNCPNEVSAARAAKLLSSLGFRQARALAGGLDGWSAAGRPVALSRESRRRQTAYD
jgi:rhodanese-related sulfurtransferase